MERGGLCARHPTNLSSVIVVESPVSDENKIAIFRDIEARLAKFPEVGDWNQKI